MLNAGTNVVTGEIDMVNGKARFPEKTVATLPAAATNEGKTYWVTDAASAGDCTVGGGSGDSWCRSNGASWASITLPAGGSGAWGGITGTLSDQTDLNTALGAKQARGYTTVTQSGSSATFSAPLGR